ncbi:MAG: hypothetical protein Q8M98_10840 [Candidatus Cloacimonadaceae bacterium]|nr:hypothetical protein [Candidatus Cloacimonadaceae bacterium]MDP3115251.1 hypothetical protein [Candidatus Cloacimonadaceae bacterium]
MIRKYRQFLPVGISTLAHLLLLLLMALYFIPPMAKEKWYELEFRDPVEEVVTMRETEREALPSIMDTVEEVNPSQAAPEAKKPAAPQALPKTERVGRVHSGPSDLIEAPVINEIKRTEAPPSLSHNPFATTGLREALRGVPSQESTGSTEHSMEGGKLSFSLKSGYRHSFADYAEVKMSFRVTETARLIESSVIILETKDRNFTETAIKVLKEGVLSFRGAPVTDRDYIITFKFKP